MKKTNILTAALLLAQLSFVSTKGQGLQTKLQACYPLDGNVTNMAATGTPLDGTPVGVSAGTGHTGVANTCYAFAGTTSSYIDLPNDYRIKPDTISFSAWVKFNNVSNRQYIVYTKNTCVSYFEGYTLHGEPTGSGYKLILVKSSNACSYATEEVLTGVTPLDTNRWYHVGFYIGKDSLKLYLNGARESAMPSHVNFDYSSTGHVYLGGTNVSYFNRPLDGYMDNVRFYNRELTAQEMLILYNHDPACDDSWCADPPRCTRYLPKESQAVGLKETQKTLALVEVFPNPSHGTLYLRHGENMTLEIYDITGKAANYTRGNLDETTQEIRLTDATEGLYLVKIRDSKGKLLQSTKIVVSH